MSKKRPIIRSATYPSRAHERANPYCLRDIYLCLETIDAPEESSSMLDARRSDAKVPGAGIVVSGNPPIQLDRPRERTDGSQDSQVAPSRNVALFSNGERIIEVGSFKQPIADLIGPMPSLVVTSLLPYAGRIICNEQISHLSNHPYANAGMTIEKFLECALERPLIKTAAEFLAYLQTLPPNYNVIPEFTQIMVSTRAQGMLSSSGGKP